MRAIISTAATGMCLRPAGNSVIPKLSRNSAAPILRRSVLRLDPVVLASPSMNFSCAP
jgi:hypothetical protein